MMALEGVRVLDLSLLLPGPFCTMFLGDFGAEVIKIEMPESGDNIRRYPPFIGEISGRHWILNRNKKSMTVNLKSEKGKEIIRRLASGSDVLIEGFRPGVMRRLGIDYERVSHINPQIIYCSLSGYGQTGPYRNWVGHDINYTGIAGIIDITGRKGEPPTMPGILTGDLGGGMMAVIGILMALFARRRIGRGQYVDVSMLDGLIPWLCHIAGDYFATNICPSRGDSRVTGGYACYTTYATKDGKYVTLGALEEKFWRNFCRVIKREDLIGDRFDAKKQARLKKILGKVFLEKTRDEWCRELENAEICLGPVNTLAEAFADPHILQREMLVKIDDPELGRTRQLGIPIKLSGTPGEIRRRSPELGEHTEEILENLGYSSLEIERMRGDKII